MTSNIREIAASIKKLDEDRQRIAEGLREKNIVEIADTLEPNLVHKIEQVKLNLRVAAVDGGLLAAEFHGFDLLMTRAVAVMFEYKDTKRVSHEYYPSPIPKDEVMATYTMDTHEFQRFKSLFRVRREILTAFEATQKFKPDYMLLDGSIIPQLSDRPGADENEARLLYDEIVSIYGKLYAFCEANKVRLVGVIKDSRGRRFIEIVEHLLVESERETLRHSSDTSFLSFLLNEYERTPAFKYSKQENEHIVLNDLKEWGSKILAFYAKPVPEDRPVRIEFLSSEGITADEIASTICALCSINKRYASPAVLIEADLRAAMNPDDLERTYKDLFVHTGIRSAMMKLRRNSRPFR